jgi:hypothetical protein
MLWMLWYADQPKSLGERVSRAAVYYQTKYGRKPTRCLIPMSEEIDGAPDGILLEAKGNVLRNHLMVGEGP